MDADAYKNNIGGFIVGGFISAALRIGQDLGLFKKLCEHKEHVTCQELADLCNLKERYVREWLGCMVATKIVSMDDDEDKYYIPEKYQPALAILAFNFYFKLWGTMIPEAEKCFMKDGPRGYSYNNMPDPLAMVYSLDERLGDGSEVVAGIHESVEKCRVSGPLSVIIDVGCGAGILSRALAKRFKGATIHGVDYSKVAIEESKKLAKAENIENVEYEVGNVYGLPDDWTKKFDWIILNDVLHDLPNPKACMRELLRILKDDGIACILDPNVHSNHRDNIGDVAVAGVGYAISSTVCLPVSMSEEGCKGHGIGWGREKKEKFLIKCGWSIKDQGPIAGNELAYNFTCVKATEQTQQTQQTE